MAAEIPRQNQDKRRREKLASKTAEVTVTAEGSTMPEDGNGDDGLEGVDMALRAHESKTVNLNSAGDEQKAQQTQTQQV